MIWEYRWERRSLTVQLRDRIENRLYARPSYEILGNPWADYRLDKDGVLHEAMSLIKQNFVHGARATVLLGRVQDVSYLSDMALFYSGHWHRWPISFTFTDNLVPALMAKILETPVQLRNGEAIIVRKDESKLEGVEKMILEKIRRDYHLCESSASFDHVIAYHVSFSGNCNSLLNIN